MSSTPYPNMGKLLPGSVPAPKQYPGFKKGLSPIYPTPNTSGMSNDPMHDAGGGNHAPVSGMMSPTQVRAMQQFLNNHGFQVAQDGILGPLTKSAAAAFRANHKGGEAWNAAHGIGVHPAVKSVAPGGRGPAGAGAGGSGVGSTDPSGYGASFDSLLAALLAGGGRVGTVADAQSFGDAAAAPSTALAAVLQRQIGANPKQEGQNQADISSWYGLDPNASSYKLSVLGRLAQARGLDAQAATDASSNIGDLAKSLAGSIGGSANDGSASVLGAGTDAAGTMAALGAAGKQYADQMDPLLRAEAVGAASREKASNSQALLDLQDRLAGARGQAKSDRAQAVFSVLDKNNALGQQRFANEGNLLSTLAQLQSVDPNAAGLKDKELQAEIAKLQAEAGYSKAKATAIANGSTTGARPAKTSLGGLVAQVTGIAGIGADHRIPAGMSVGGLAHLVGSALQSAGIPKTDSRYQRLAQTIMGSFLDPNGNPLAIPSGWFGPSTR